MKFSNRLDRLEPYPFVEISRIIAEKRAAREDSGYLRHRGPRHSHTAPYR